MPRLIQPRPKYCLHKGSKQATVSINGERHYLGPFGSRQSHIRYQEYLKQWYAHRDASPEVDAPKIANKIAKITAATLREKRRQGAGGSSHLQRAVLVFWRHAREYYRKQGEPTREATLVDDVIRSFRKYHHRRSRLAAKRPIRQVQIP